MSDETSPAPVTIGLLGSGEFLDWAEAPDLWLLDHARPDSKRVIVLPTASAPEGDEVFDRWGSMGVEHYTRLGYEPEVLPLKTRADAEREDLASAVAGARLVFFSGGNPRYLTDVLRDSPFWRAVLDALGNGTALGGCSAGAALLGERAPDSSRQDMSPDVWGPGLAYFKGVDFAPHWDALDRYVPGLQKFVLDSLTPGALHVLIDEDTAMVGDGETWTVMGRGAVTLAHSDVEQVFRAGQTFSFSEAGRRA
jgi:cyanophycinase